VQEEQVRAGLFALSADSMQGRATGTPGAARAARYIAERLRASGVAAAYPGTPGGDSAYFQRVPLVAIDRPDGRRVLRLLPALSELDTVPAERRVVDVNVVGLVRGRDPQLAHEAVIVGAHFDHVGIGTAVGGDSIYNGADDDASGVAAVLAIADALAAGPAPRRTVVLLLTTGEELGMLGTRWYAENPVVPLERTVADLQIEMIGRPDSLAGGAGRAWLTGYERSTMGETFAAAGLPVVADPRPAMRFFERSDNIVFAVRGIPAHTLSSYNLHTDYHQPADEVAKLDAEHMAGVTRAAIAAVRLLADADEAPAWKPGGRPERRR